MLTLGLACSRNARLGISALTVEVPDGADVLALDADAARALVIEQFKGSPWQMLAEGAQAPEGAPQVRLQAVIAAAEPDTQAPEGHVRVRLTLKPRAAEAFMVDAVEREPAKAQGIEGVQQASRQALVRALGEALREAEGVLTWAGKSDSELISLLNSREPGQAAAATRLLVQRKNAAAMRPLLERLEHGDAELVGAVMGQLVELGDPSAVGPLIEISRKQSPLVQRAIVFALGSLGGDEAEGYLMTVAEGHDDEVLQAAARQSLDELRAHKAREPR